MYISVFRSYLSSWNIFLSLQSSNMLKDQSPAAVLRRIQLQLPDEADFLLVRLISFRKCIVLSVKQISQVMRAFHPNRFAH